MVEGGGTGGKWAWLSQSNTKDLCGNGTVQYLHRDGGRIRPYPVIKCAALNTHTGVQAELKKSE